MPNNLTDLVFGIIASPWVFLAGSVVFILIPLAAFAQEDSGAIRGTIYGPLGETVPYLWIQATESSTAEYSRAESTTEGRYEITGLRAGTYTLNINPPCCVYMNFESDEIQLGDEEVRDFEIRLEQAELYTIGDDPGVLLAWMRSEANVPDAPAPRTVDGKPDISGVWLVDTDPFPEPIEAHDWAQELFEERVASDVIDLPTSKCLPGSAPINWVVKIVQTPDLIVILFESSPGFRQIFLDGRDHPEDPNPSWMGHSIGHWEGDTLVIDTIGFNDRGWMSIYPRSEDLHIVERLTRTTLARMDVDVTIEDPRVFKKPWVRNQPAYLAPDVEMIE